MFQRCVETTFASRSPKSEQSWSRYRELKTGSLEERTAAAEFAGWLRNDELTRFPSMLVSGVLTSC